MQKPKDIQTDHDLLIRLEAKVDQIIVDVKELKDGTSVKLADHDLRLQACESYIHDQKLTVKVYITIASAIGALVGFIISSLNDIFNLINKTH